jgi:hypothetical protein
VSNLLRSRGDPNRLGRLPDAHRGAMWVDIVRSYAPIQRRSAGRRRPVLSSHRAAGTQARARRWSRPTSLRCPLAAKYCPGRCGAPKEGEEGNARRPRAALGAIPGRGADATRRDGYPAGARRRAERLRSEAGVARADCVCTAGAEDAGRRRVSEGAAAGSPGRGPLSTCSSI